MNPPTRTELADYAINTNCRFPCGRAASEVLLILRHLLALLDGSVCFLASGHLPEVCSLSRPMMFQSVSAPLQHGIRFLWPLIPASPSSCLTAVLPRREQYGLTTLRRNDKTGLGSLCTPKVLSVHDTEGGSPCSDLVSIL
jgi:hypothetical protein